MLLLFVLLDRNRKKLTLQNSTNYTSFWFLLAWWWTFFFTEKQHMGVCVGVPELFGMIQEIIVLFCSVLESKTFHLNVSRFFPKLSTFFHEIVSRFIISWEKNTLFRSLFLAALNRSYYRLYREDKYYKRLYWSNKN